MVETAKSLRERWSAEDIRRINELLSHGGTGLQALARVDVEGELYIDLRGLTVDGLVRGVELQRVDFSHAKLAGPGQFIRCSIGYCRFVSAKLDSNLGNQFLRCDFTKANFKRALLRGEFTDCDFSGSDMSRAQGGTLKLVGCRLEQVRLDSAELQDSVFERCRLRDCSVKDASFAGVRFVSCDMQGVDFSTALMDAASFS